MSEIDVTQIKFRASSNWKLMTDPKLKSEELSETTKTYLRGIYRELKYERRSVVSTKVLERGNQGEEGALTLLSRAKQKFFKKNTERISNLLIIGTPDAIPINEDIKNASEGFDTKVSWQLSTFPFKDEKLDKQYYWQNMSYCALTGAKKWTTCYTLVNAHAYMIFNEKRKLFFTMGCPEEKQLGDNTIYNRYKKDAEMIERNMIFDIKEFIKDNPAYDMEIPVTEWIYDIPLSERIIEFETIRDEAAIKALYLRIHQCRAYMSQKIKNNEW